MTSTTDFDPGAYRAGVDDAAIDDAFLYSAFPDECRSVGDVLDQQSLLRGLVGSGGFAAVAAATAEPGMPLPIGSALNVLLATDPLSLVGGARIDLVRALERCRSALDAAEQVALVAVRSCGD